MQIVLSRIRASAFSNLAIPTGWPSRHLKVTELAARCRRAGRRGVRGVGQRDRLTVAVGLRLPGVEILLLNRDDLRRVLAVGVPPEGFGVEFEERLAPRELREDSLGLLALAEDGERGGERLDGVQSE